MPRRRALSGGIVATQLSLAVTHFEYAEQLITGLTVVVGSATADQTVTWGNGGFTDTNYQIIRPTVALNSISLGATAIAVIKPGTITKTGCIVTVTTNAVLSAGNATLFVMAYKLGL